MMNNENHTCNACGRPFVKQGDCYQPVCACPTGTAEYSNCEAVTIPTVTVDTIDGINNLSDCFVFVTSTNTTYYIDDKHRIITAWKGVVEADDYDVAKNKLNLRSQLLYTSTVNSEGETVPIIIYFDKDGVGHVTNEEGEMEQVVQELKNLIQDEADEREEQYLEIQDQLLRKQDTLTPGTGISLNGSIINNTGVTNIYPGQNVEVSNYSGDVTISATDTKYSAGTGISISPSNVISLAQAVLPGWGIAEQGVGTLNIALNPGSTANLPLTVVNLEFESVDDYAVLLQPESENNSLEWVGMSLAWDKDNSTTVNAMVCVTNLGSTAIPATAAYRYTIIGKGYGGSGSDAILYSGTGQNTDGAMTQKATTDELITLNQNLNNAQTNLQGQIDLKADKTEVDAKQDKLTAGANIVIDGNNVISAVDTKYTAGTGISISAANVISATGGATGLRLQTGTVDIGEGIVLPADTIYGVYE